jgi:pimeloyl-ACP methyl ester carboxylesterase
VKARSYLSKWRSPEAEAKFRSMEDELWTEYYSRRPEPIDVETPHGTTRAYRWAGPGDPIVFLHGIGGTSLLWASYAEEMIGHDVWSIDIVGDAGRSVQRSPYVDPDDLGAELESALAALGLQRVMLVGHSLGGWLGLNLLIRRPNRVAAAILLDPVGIGPLHMLGFMLWGFPVLLGAYAPERVRLWMAKRFRMALLEDRRAIRLALHGQINHPPRIPRLLPFTDEELRSIEAPVAVLVGERTEPFDADEVTSRARKLIAKGSVALVPDAGHAFPVDHVDLVLSYVAQMAGEAR